MNNKTYQEWVQEIQRLRDKIILPDNKRIDKFRFTKPFERGETLFSKGFLFYLHSQTIRKSQSLIYFKQNKVEVFILN